MLQVRRMPCQTLTVAMPILYSTYIFTLINHFPGLSDPFFTSFHISGLSYPVFITAWSRFNNPSDLSGPIFIAARTHY